MIFDLCLKVGVRLRPGHVLMASRAPTKGRHVNCYVVINTKHHACKACSIVKKTKSKGYFYPVGVILQWQNFIP